MRTRILGRHIWFEDTDGQFVVATLTNEIHFQNDVAAAQAVIQRHAIDIEHNVPNQIGRSLDNPIHLQEIYSNDPDRLQISP